MNKFLTLFFVVFVCLIMAATANADDKEEIDVDSLKANKFLYSVRLNWEGINCSTKKTDPACTNNYRGHCAKQYKVLIAETPIMENTQVLVFWVNRGNEFFHNNALDDNKNYFYLAFGYCEEDEDD